MPELVVTQRDGTQHTVLYDEADAELVAQYTWHVRNVPETTRFYARTNTYSNKDGVITRGIITMHKLFTGRNYVIHKNGNGLDNRRENLTFQVGRSQYRGVSWDTHKNQWAVRVRHKNKQHFAGRFYNEQQAARAYDEEAIRILGLEKALPRLNFPDEALGGPA